MTAFDRNHPPASAMLDGDGRLRHAEPRLAGLNARAGGEIGQPLAVPAMAELVRISRRLEIEVARRIVVADGEDDLTLWVQVEPEADGLRLTVGAWRLPDEHGVLDEQDDAADALAADWRWDADSGLHLTYVSPGAGARFGFDAADVLGRPLTWLFQLSDDGEGGFPMLAAMASHQRFEGQHATLRGTDRMVLLSGMPRTDAGGRFAGFSGAAHATEPEPDAKAEAGLPPAFGRRLRQALRDPLDRIVAYADSISARADGPLLEDYAGYAGDIASAGRHLAGLVNDLEDAQAVEDPDFAVAIEPLDLADVARRAAGLLAVRAERADVTIERLEPEATLPARGEFRRALQILVNLIGNAVRYSPPGSSVGVRLERQGALACAIVQDHGKGIAPEDQARIFEKFERVDPTEQGGSGLGLFIARRLARAMGGDIAVESAVGEGARFVLTLPVDG
ncbi:ATP-binding protein [Sphingomonas sp. ac-8]|uniref:sensor histidine kinase n=1 Tax=Sphingomonas sp. ac-8 TaxID=3242977 RepID=UPI003A7FEC22